MVEKEERHWHGGGDAWSPSDSELRLEQSVRRWRRAWSVGFLAAPCVLAGLTGDQVEWLTLAGILLWAGSVGYLIYNGQIAA